MWNSLRNIKIDITFDDQKGCGRGIYHDALTSFHRHYREIHCEGDRVKLPIDYEDLFLDTVAKIIFKGFVDAKYFPCYLPKTLLQVVFLGEYDEDKLYDDFVNYLKPIDKRKLLNVDEAIEILDEFHFKERVTSNNLKESIIKCANIKLIKKCKYFISIWQEKLKNLITKDELRIIFERSIVNRVNFINSLSVQNETLFNWVYQFAHDNEHLLPNLVMFITGLDILTSDKIKIVLSESGDDGYACFDFRSCFSTLTVPRRVINNNVEDKYAAFAEELTAILGFDTRTNVA